MKTKVSLALIAILLVVVGVLYILLERNKDRIQLKNVELSTLQDSVAVYQSKNGDLSFKLASVVIDKGNLKESLNIAGFDIKELKAQNIKWRRVTNALKLELKAVGSVETGVTDTFYVNTEVPGKIDTVWYSTIADWSNDYLSIYNGKIIQKKLNFDYNYKVGINLIQTTKRKSIIVTAKLTDPNASITTANSITVKHKTNWYQKWWLWSSAGLIGGAFLAK
jgi:hypothetical protein